MEGWRRFARDKYTIATDPFYGPPPLINDVVDCWVDEGVRFYTNPHYVNGMAYHVMLPTQELEFHVNKDSRSHSYSYMAQELVEQGYPPRAVNVVISKAGTATIERDADIVNAAKQVGLAELPVLFVYEGES